MPTWSELINEINTLIEQKDPRPLDTVRRKYLSALAAYSGRDTIVYATQWTAPLNIPPGMISITEEDLYGFMEVVHGLKSKKLDLILHSPGGSPEATEAIVAYLRSKFSDIRVIIPQAAMSAATLLSCAANSIVMSKHSSLGPVDPQMILQTPLGLRAVPAQSILDQFDMARNEAKESSKLGPWMPLLSQYGPALLVECENALALSRRLTADWLATYMLAGKKNSRATAGNIANELAAHKKFKSHSRHIDITHAKRLGLTIEDLEADQKFQDGVLSVFHAFMHTFNNTKVVKIIENHCGRCYLKQLP